MAISLYSITRSCLGKSLPTLWSNPNPDDIFSAMFVYVLFNIKFVFRDEGNFVKL